MLLTTLQLEILFVLALLLPLVIQLVVLFGVSRLLWNFSHRRYGRGLWTALALVGVPMHELSHAIAFLVTGAGVRRMVLFSPKGLSEYDGATGVVVPARKPSTFSLIVASIAPFFGCSLVAYLVLRLLLPDVTLEGVQVSLAFTDVQSENILSAIGSTLVGYLSGLQTTFQQLNFLDWRTYLAIYLGASLGLGAAPSREDFKHFFPALGVLLLVLFPVFFVLQLAGSPEQAFAVVQNTLGGLMVVISTALIYATVFALLALVVLVLLNAVRQAATR